ncbi:MAG TPA: MBL fold metallo-hydrolase, partial [Phycisphaerae bacterium]|nr:MBL fold metallo-hydrolase [Phycisphaerae bacterium]
MSQPVNIKTIPVGPLETNCHVIWNESDCFLFDAGWQSPKLVQFLKDKSLVPSHVFCTHGHGDHIGGLKDIKANFPQIHICCPAGDIAMLSDPYLNFSASMMLNVVAPAADIVVKPGDIFKMGSLEWLVLDTSGHTAGGVSYYCRQADVVVGGDALFAGSVGRCDLPGGSYDRLMENIHKNLLSLPDETVV